MLKKVQIFFILSAALVSGTSAADNGCQKVLALGATQATGPATFSGDADSNFGAMAVDVAINSTKGNPDGSINATTSHTFTAGSLVFTTRDRARLVPLNAFGLYRLETHATIADGAWGHLKLKGLLDFATGRARWLAEGEVCSD